METWLMGSMRSRIATCCAFLLLANISSMAESAKDDFFEEYSVEKKKINYAGWKGIAFYCSPSNEQKEAAEKICERVQAGVKFLAAASNVELKIATNAVEFGSLSAEGRLLSLQVDIQTTKGPTTGMSARVEASSYYSRAVNLVSDDKDPRKTPRKGDLIFFWRNVVGASSDYAEPLVGEMVNSLDTVLKEFFADFIVARRTAPVKE